MRLTITLAALSAAALATASVLRNTAYNGCLDVVGDIYEQPKLVLSRCDEVENGDWVIDVKDDDSAVIRNAKLFWGDVPLCVGIYLTDDGKPRPTLLPCSVAVVFNRVEDTSPKSWSFSKKIADDQLALAPLFRLGDRMAVELLPVTDLQGNVRLYQWSTSMPKKPKNQELYDWMRFQGR
ncbi:hypothetical protein BGZ70_001434 [Mortierella alpina]|uniref:Uncharacterized protein n=1 Tax=Mortierella alpina TaxID=64518 RepID=A0A9P6JBV1_MORAP|nr:hypothetical protein BGZ70_001434 [Mortierella alpina]